MSLLPPTLPTKHEPTLSHDYPKEKPTASASALKAIKRAALKSAIFAGKIVALPIEFAALGVVATATAISALFSLPLRLVVSSDTSLKPFHHLASTVDSLWEVVKITYNFGLYPDEERLQLTDNEADAPRFALITPKNPSNAAPVLYAPGYLDTPATLRRTCRKLADELNAPVYIVRYRSLFQPIEEDAKDVARLEARIKKDTGQNDIVLIGHSMGGINTGRNIQQLGPDATNVVLWVTLCSPLQGAPLAKLVPGHPTDDMRPDSQVIQDLNERGVLDDVPSLHIYTLTDGVVPTYSAVGTKGSTHASYQCKFPYSHIGMRSKPEVLEQIKLARDKAVSQDV
ncbi:MAG: hypothetical protein LLF94_06310 [Chlamydiales bacterium]|nr:hypothetical protein [Chlamydiales bacterium]